MDLNLDRSLIDGYHSKAQISRVLSENWVAQNMFCPRCGNMKIEKFENNRPVADFYCPFCKNEYELKSKSGNLGRKITDGAYSTMIERITSHNNPDFFFMTYSKDNLTVKNFIFVPKYFFVPDIIEKRKPLSQTAQRIGWVGCNILIDKIPKQGRISIISNGELSDVQSVVKSVSQSEQLEINNIDSRGWLFDVLNCVNQIAKEEFDLQDVYYYEKLLKIKHPNNNNIKAKIRQQLQLLRDKGFIKFQGNGKYLKL